LGAGGRQFESGRPDHSIETDVRTKEGNMLARIYKPAKTAMQSGTAKTREWVLEYAPESPREVEPLMGWTSSRDMRSQVRVSFPTKEEAIAYAKRNGIPYQVREPKPRRQTRKSYSDNFKFGRKEAWTH
jgi:hypothetical protein